MARTVAAPRIRCPSSVPPFSSIRQIFERSKAVEKMPA
jgi:hypothetical protein